MNDGDRPRLPCGIGFNIKECYHPGVLFGGGQFREKLDPSRYNQCPNCKRLLPLAQEMPGPERHDIFLSLTCNRKDAHPPIGAHWYEHGGIQVFWTMSAETWNGPWSA